MLKKILNGKTCAECRLCCVFDSSDVWETPVFTAEIRDKIMQYNPDTRFIPKDGGFILKVGNLREDELFTCPALTEKGCILGDEKPFDCRIWPYRIMEIGGKRAITIASICEELYNRPLSQLVNFLKDGLAEKIFAYADEHPEIVKPYEEGYPVLLFETMH
jgi:Fe-S-cluster containining protein